MCMLCGIVYKNIVIHTRMSKYSYEHTAGHNNLLMQGQLLLCLRIKLYFK